jgi:hypothetical protein
MGNADVQDPESGLDLPHRTPNLTRGPAKYFYGTEIRTRMTGFLAVTIVVLVVVSKMLAA